ncbi:MAG: hypothetical protein A2481_03685 [Candidatus Yonathbacteria bacterium RIFOXYC2_FULL_47_9]|nr:MAG: hypothetical protein A2481_03685 [Candidatus Yonathbacteria bacterium RIFOXYC2_FULL_47_9]HAT68792.1 hypothetical protein [Candidatus Yonathbacteria bacterium]
MKSFSKTTLLLLSGLTLTATLGGAYTFLFVAMKNKTTATAELSAQNEALAGKESRVSSALSSVKEDSANIEKLSAYFIKESEIVAFTKKIELLGEQSGTEISLEALDPGVGVNDAPILNFRIVAMGEFQNVMRLIGLLENFPAKFEWKSVDLSRNETAVDPKAPKAAQWEASISLAALNFLKE